MKKLFSHSGKLDRLEAIRGFAAVYVVINHTMGKTFFINNINVAFLFRFGQEAVILFFILSGIVIQYSFSQSSDKSFQSYFFKRFFRIYIPLLLIFILNYLVISITKNEFITVNWPNLIGNLFMLQDSANIKPGVLFSTFMNNLPLWSLSYEWWFYMLFFFIHHSFRKQASQAAYALGLLGAFTYLIYPNFASRVLTYLPIWWIGTDIAQLYIRGSKINGKTLLTPLCVLVACAIVLSANVLFNSTRIQAETHDSGFGISPYLELRHFIVAIIFIGVSIYWRQLKWIGFNWIFGWFKYLAPISYVLYIAHFFLISQAHYLDKFITNPSIRLLAYTIICLSISYFIERIIYPSTNRFLSALFIHRYSPLRVQRAASSL